MIVVAGGGAGLMSAPAAAGHGRPAPLLETGFGLGGTIRLGITGLRPEPPHSKPHLCAITLPTRGVTRRLEKACPRSGVANHPRHLVTGTICGGGSLGSIIPPSVPVVVLAPIAAMSIGGLLAGILIPGLLMSGLFIVYILIVCTIKPSLAPPETEPDPRSFGEKIRLTLSALISPAFLIFTVLGTLFMGLTTPTEAAACGSLGVLLLAIIYRRMSWSLLFQAALQAVSLTAMILAIILAGGMFSGVFFASGGMTATKAVLDAFGVSPWSVIAVILFVAFILGFLIDSISIILIIVPIAIPLVKSFGIDPLWFALVLLVMLQTAYLTPPMAPSIFYLRAIAPPSMKLKDMYWGVIPLSAANCWCWPC